MMIRDMFAEDINRPINGVIKVDQDAADVIEQEVREYVITRELKRHFISFFNYYSDAFEKPTADIGVWISGFFGSGKSHFLKMLSYILENKSVNGVSTVERFRQKFADDPATFMLIDRATRGKTETILFNIDIEGSINKDKTAVLRVFAKVFYNHLGFFGDNLKVAMLEQYIEQLGKTEEFRRVFEAKKGKPWEEQRKVFAFNGKYIVPTLMEVLDISEEDAQHWFNDKTAVEFSIAQLVEDIKAYVNKQPENFRLLFMIDEVGQYVGTDTDMLLNLQSLTEKIGSECGGKVWVVCTGQEAIDEIIKVRADEFSRIQARFKTRLSLSSSSVDEVIQKRVLAKKPEAEKLLEGVYQENDSVLRNLFSFAGSVLDIKGYGGANEFAENFPFVPYQFIIMQKVFAEIRKHGNSGKHLSGGERSMLSGFQEAAQKIQQRDEYALVPFFRFYDTVHGFLDSSIRRVIERCQNAANSGLGVEPQDVDVLKLLYLIRYVDDIPANVDNIVILMADDIRTDKIVLREKVAESLGHLMSQNYIGRSGDIYNFLTDEEQDVQRDIQNTVVDTASIVERIAQMIYADIYQTKKFRRDKYDFDFDKMVDGVTTGAVTGGMKLRFLTVATDAIEKSELRLMTESHGQAIVVLSGSSYYESLESAMKIRKFVKQRNVAQLPKSMQDITSYMQPEETSFKDAAVSLCSFVTRKTNCDYQGRYVRFNDITDMNEQAEMLRKIASREAQKYAYTVKQSTFFEYPDSRIIFWETKAFQKTFKASKSLGEVCQPRQGMATTNNELFLRLWHEPQVEKVGFGYHNEDEAEKSGLKWFPYNKGGGFRKWYGNNEYIVNYEQRGKTICDYIDNTPGARVGSNGRVINRQFFFNTSITWSDVCGNNFAARSCPNGFIFDVKGSSAFVSQHLYEYILAFLNSKVNVILLNGLNPSVTTQVGDLKQLPFIMNERKVIPIREIVACVVGLSKSDWDSFETSWDFKCHPLLNYGISIYSGLGDGSNPPTSYFGVDQNETTYKIYEKNTPKAYTLRSAFEMWMTACNDQFNQLKANEEELNRIFIDIYGLQGELTPEVADKDVTVHYIVDTKDDIPASLQGSSYVLTRRDVIVSLISYAVGCMFGRYSLDVDGLVYAGGDFDAKYCRWVGYFGDQIDEHVDENGDLIGGGWAGCSSFKYDGIRKDGKWVLSIFPPDTDNIIPICDDEYFEDDIVGRFVKFIETVYGSDTLEENLKFIADALGGKGTPRDVIRSYFLNDFYADHCKTYQKRPIYWLFDSGKKNGFKALIYMHRYQPDTIARIRTDYVHEQQSRYRTAIADLESRIAAASTAERVKLNKQLKTLQEQDAELRTYEEKIHHLADQMISIDLDDGVKVNYAKFQDVLGKIK